MMFCSLWNTKINNSTFENSYEQNLSSSFLFLFLVVVWEVVDDAKVSFLWLLFKRDSNCISILHSITLMTGKLLPKYCDPIWTLTEARRKQECCEKDICRTIHKSNNELVFIYLRHGQMFEFCSMNIYSSNKFETFSMYYCHYGCYPTL